MQSVASILTELDALSVGGAQGHFEEDVRPRNDLQGYLLIHSFLWTRNLGSQGKSQLTRSTAKFQDITTVIQVP